MLIVERYYTSSSKISCMDESHFWKQINNFEYEIISVKPTTPDATDTKQWYEVYYKVPF